MRMPHHRHAYDDRHSFAPVSRFLDDDVRTTLNVVEEAPKQMVVHAAATNRVVVDLDPLWN
jgi:hypothetical protein